MHLKLSSAKWRPFCSGLNMLILMRPRDAHLIAAIILAMIGSHYIWTNSGLLLTGRNLNQNTRKWECVWKYRHFVAAWVCEVHGGCGGHTVQPATTLYNYSLTACHTSTVWWAGPQVACTDLQHGGPQVSDVVTLGFGNLNELPSTGCQLTL